MIDSFFRLGTEMGNSWEKYEGFLALLKGPNTKTHGPW